MICNIVHDSAATLIFANADTSHATPLIGEHGWTFEQCRGRVRGNRTKGRPEKRETQKVRLILLISSPLSLTFPTEPHLNGDYSLDCPPHAAPWTRTHMTTHHLVHPRFDPAPSISLPPGLSPPTRDVGLCLASRRVLDLRRVPGCKTNAAPSNNVKHLTNGNT